MIQGRPRANGCLPGRSDAEYLMRDVSTGCDSSEKLGWTKDGALRAGTVHNEARQQLECTYSVSCNMLIRRDGLI